MTFSLGMIAADTPAVGAVYDRPGSSNVGLINKAGGHRPPLQRFFIAAKR